LLSDRSASSIELASSMLAATCRGNQPAYGVVGGLRQLVDRKPLHGK
jgi:hypothetical protein